MTESEIEVELRGRLSKSSYNDLLVFLKENGEFVEHKHRVLLDYSTFLLGEGINERKRDIRLRITNGVPEIITKIGGWGGDEHRREISIKTEPGSFDRLVETYGHLGFTKAIIAERFTEVFMYQGYEFALVTVPTHSYYFEVEAMISEIDDLSATKAKMRSICNELNLILFDDKGFFDYIDELNREVNEVFEFKNFKPNYFAKRFNF